MNQAKPERGEKRVCTNCDARFYDLGHTPPTCPKCGTVFVEPVRPPPVLRRNQKWGPFGKGRANQPMATGVNENSVADGFPPDGENPDKEQDEDGDEDEQESKEEE